MIVFFYADEHIGNTFFIEFNSSITGACRRARITKDCTHHPASTSTLSNSPVSASLGVPLTPEEFKKPSSSLQDCTGQQGAVGGLLSLSSSSVIGLVRTVQVFIQTVA